MSSKATTTATKFEVEKFDGNVNFLLWKMRVTSLLVKEGTYQALQGIRKKPSTMGEDDCDESMATKKREPIVVPMGPVTRARAKQFKERLNGLIHKIQQEGLGLHMEGDQKLINIIQVTPTHIDQLVQDGIQVRSN